MKFLRSKRGSSLLWVPFLALVLLVFSMAMWERSRLTIIAQGCRDAVQSAGTQVCADNYKNVYNGVREGYSGGYKLADANWTQNVTASDIIAKVDTKLGTSGGVKSVDGKTEFSISDLSISLQNAPLAPTDAENAQQFKGTVTYTLTVPLSSAWSALPPMVVHEKLDSGFSPQGEAAFGGSGDASGPQIENLSLSASNMTLDKGDTNVIAASIVPDDAESRKINWSSTDSSVCAVTQTGAVTGVGVGSASVVALTDNGRMAQCNVTVVSPVAGISLDKSNIKMIKGAAETLTATVRPADATNKGVQWATSDSSVCTVDQSGHISAVGAGAATITVMTQEGGFFAECAITVTIPVSGITLDKTNMTVTKGVTDTLTATVWPGDATRHDILWASSNSSVCTVDSAGHISAIGVGAAVISATTEDGQYTATCNINVVIPVTGITVSPSTLTLIRYTSGQLTATVSPPDATDKTVYWTSSNSTVCTVDGTGRVTGAGVGTAIVTAKTRDGGYTATSSITVKPNTYNVMVNSNFGGTAYGTGTYNAGSNVILSEVPYEHYHFTGWSINGVTVGMGGTYTIYNLSADVTVTANFAIDTFTINVYGSTGGSASGSGTYPFGANITLQATANPGYRFIGWSDGALDNPRGYTVTTNATITATFALDYDVTAWFDHCGASHNTLLGEDGSCYISVFNHEDDRDLCETDVYFKFDSPVTWNKGDVIYNTTNMIEDITPFTHGRDIDVYALINGSYTFIGWQHYQSGGKYPSLFSTIPAYASGSASQFLIKYWANLYASRSEDGWWTLSWGSGDLSLFGRKINRMHVINN